jgi:bifunctional non-homologous end joining protein LigD
LPTITAAELMHPELHHRPFTAPGWPFEHKLDGFRALARCDGGDVELSSRTGRSLAHAFPEVIHCLTDIGSDCVLDGELVVPDARGHPSFEGVRRRALMRRPAAIAAAVGKTPAALHVFDVLTC